MEKIFFDTFIEAKTSKQRSPKKDSSGKSQRHVKKEIGIECNKIMALTTAGGSGKSPLLYVDGYETPLQLPDLSFDEARAKIEEFTKRKEFIIDYFAGNVFLTVEGDEKRYRVLVNKQWVQTLRETTGEIVFRNGQKLEGLSDEGMKRYSIAAEEEDKKFQQILNTTNTLLSSVSKRDFENKVKKIKEELQPIDDVLNMNGCLSFINIIVNLILTVLVIILLLRL